MALDKYTVAYKKDGVTYKVCKIFFGSDGSYYVTSPYHPEQKAVLLKTTVNYALQEWSMPLSQALDVASADEKRIKLSHHPDGFVQFSGQGVVSGKDEQGNIRGIGVMSWPLGAPVRGPAFIITIRGVEQFEQVNRLRGKSCVFHHEELTPMPKANVLFLEGHYFPPLWRRFIQTEQDGTKTISVVHPAGAVLRLKVIFAPEQCDYPGFIGLELYTDQADDDEYKVGYIMLFVEKPMHTTQGHTIKLHDNGIDFRDYLDAQAIYNGDQLLLWADGGWIVARYEVADFHERAVVLESVDAVRRLDRATMRFRWPTKEEQ